MPALVWKGVRLLLLSLAVVALLAILLFVGANAWVLAQTQGRIEHDVAMCGPERVGIVFGTSRWTRSGRPNPHFAGRMAAAERLVKEGRVEHLLLSGDNATRYYNEPVTMWRHLRRKAVPEAVMTLDYAGFSTFDTLARARDVFAVERALLITQAWHLPRALFIADSLGIEARGCAAPERPSEGAIYLRFREWVARVATLGDLYLWGREPHFLGPLEPLQLDSPEPKAPVSDAEHPAASDTGVTTEETPGREPGSDAGPGLEVDASSAVELFAPKGGEAPEQAREPWPGRQERLGPEVSASGAASADDKARESVPDNSSSTAR